MSKVSIDHPHANTGDLHRAIWLAQKMKQAGEWDGETRLVFKSPTVLGDDVRETDLTGKLRLTRSNIQE